MRLHAASKAITITVALTIFITLPAMLRAAPWQADKVTSGSVPIMTSRQYQEEVQRKLEAIPDKDPAETDPITVDSPNSDPPQVPAEAAQETLDDGELPRELTDRERERKNALSKCLAIYYTRQVDAEVLRPWSIMHGLIGYGEETLIIYRGRRYDATEYLCANGIGDDRRILYAEDGKLRTRMGIGVQGHEAQLLAMLAQANVPHSRPLTADGQDFTVADLVQTEMESCRSDSELTFKLIGLAHYLQSDKVWENAAGEEWSLERLLKEELAQPVDDGACGGTHRLMALSYALAQRKAEGKPIDGHWYRAERFISDFQAYSWKFQHREGSFSTGWFKEKKFSGEVEKRLYTTGHILEWLVFSLPEEDLKDPRIERTVDFLLNLMLSTPNYDLAVGPRGHALHALRMYEEKVFGKSDYTRFMNNKRLVNNNPQNGGGTSKPDQKSGDVRLFPAGFRRGKFNRR
ncbi:MAG: hypothetical protein GY819_09450 [Planctomycetaceae bacterium]|nr:hypothetical protein [Planctomycetaceae bacterium]MCP4463006.1 hypothetical protein [Planctomycetaceae bacterium]MDG1808036.1 hypothetical protein [Pirellulaceae bacterium]MDG2105405.1 hypothetical protein [Pirellulaceae bacterium]